MFNHSPARHGTFLRCFHLGKHLVERGHEVTLVALNPVKTCSSLLRTSYVDGVQIIDTLSFKKDHDYLGIAIGATINPFIELSTRPDVVHGFAVTSGCTATPVMFAKFFKKFGLFKGKVLADIDDWWARPLSAFWFLFTFFEKESFKRSDAVTVPSNGLRQRAVAFGARSDMVYCIPNGSNVEFIKPMNKSQARERLQLDNINNYYLLYIGPTEGTFLFVKALKYLFQMRKDVKAIFVGNLPDKDKYVIKNSGFQENIIMTGWQPYEKIPLYCGASDVLVFPMGEGIGEETRSPITFADYMASGRPIVSNAVGEVKKILKVTKCGITTSPTDPEDLAKKINILLDDSKLCSFLGNKARRIAENNFSWQVLAKNLEEIYNSLLKETN
jgi:glycosyltransferase involved in cell wall biosynthesis